MTATAEDRYYLPPDPPDTEEVCRYESADGTECGREVAYLSEVLCHPHLDLVDAGVISWKEYRALVDHHAA